MTAPRSVSETEPRSIVAPEPPQAAERVFGAALPLAREYADLLVRDAVPRGLIGPREAQRLWDRHLLNAAMLTELVPSGERIVDVGSGAGLPGIPMAIRRPDLRVDLVEPMLRRTTFLADATAALQLRDRVRVVRGRAEDRSVLETVGDANYVVARAVAPLDRLAGWCLPLLAPGGTLLAMKGASAPDELAQHGTVLRRMGAKTISVASLDAVSGVEPTFVVAIRADRKPGRGASR